MHTIIRRPFAARSLRRTEGGSLCENFGDGSWMSPIDFMSGYELRSSFLVLFYLLLSRVLPMGRINVACVTIPPDNNVVIPPNFKDLPISLRTITPR